MTSSPQLNSIIARAQAGDPDAIDLLFEQFHRRVYHIALGIMRDEMEAEDAVQDTFVKLFRRIGQFRGDSAFETWLIRIAINVCRDRIRRQSVRHFLSIASLTPAALLRAFGPGEDPEQEVVELERGRSLWQAVGDLDMRLRVPLVLRYQEGLSCGEIAEILELSVSTIYTRLSLGRSQLREVLQPPEETEPAEQQCPATETG